MTQHQNGFSQESVQNAKKAIKRGMERWKEHCKACPHGHTWTTDFERKFLAMLECASPDEMAFLLEQLGATYQEAKNDVYGVPQGLSLNDLFRTIGIDSGGVGYVGFSPFGERQVDD